MHAQPVLELGRQLLVAGAIASLFADAALVGEAERRQVGASLRRLLQEATAAEESEGCIVPDSREARAGHSSRRAEMAYEPTGSSATSAGETESLRRRLRGVTLSALRKAYWADRDAEAKAQYHKRVKAHKRRVEEQRARGEQG